MLDGHMIGKTEKLPKKYRKSVALEPSWCATSHTCTRLHRNTVQYCVNTCAPTWRGRQRLLKNWRLLITWARSSMWRVYCCFWQNRLKHPRQTSYHSLTNRATKSFNKTHLYAKIFIHWPKQLKPGAANNFVLNRIFAQNRILFF